MWSGFGSACTQWLKAEIAGAALRPIRRQATHTQDRTLLKGYADLDWPHRRQASSHRYCTGLEADAVEVGAGLPAKGLQSSPLRSISDLRAESYLYG